MTNTLHRYGSPESLTDDYIVFTIPARGINDLGAETKVRAFLQASLKYNPVNLGDASKGSIFRPSKSLNLVSAYVRRRRHSIAPQELIEQVTGPGTVAVVFDDKDAFDGFLGEVKRLDLGLSVNTSTLLDETRRAGKKAGICPHSVEYSLGFRGRTDKLPTERVLEMATMCGHGMVSSSYTQKMIDMVKEGRLSPEKASQYMAKFCVCGVFNVSRARRLLEDARRGV